MGPGEVLKIVGLALMGASLAALAVGALWQRRTTSAHLDLMPSASLSPGRGQGRPSPIPKRRRLIWRAGESPFFEADPDDIGVSVIEARTESPDTRRDDSSPASTPNPSDTLVSHSPPVQGCPHSKVREMREERIDTGVSQRRSPPSYEGEERGAPTSQGSREANKPPDPPQRRLRPRGERRVVNLYLDKELYERFKERCTAEKATISEKMEELISSYLEGGA